MELIKTRNQILKLIQDQYNSRGVEHATEEDHSILDGKVGHIKAKVRNKRFFEGADYSIQFDVHDLSISGGNKKGIIVDIRKADQFTSVGFSTTTTVAPKAPERSLRVDMSSEEGIFLLSSWIEYLFHDIDIRHNMSVIEQYSSSSMNSEMDDSERKQAYVNLYAAVRNFKLKTLLENDF